MNTYDFVHLTLHALGGQVRGKTKLQKMIYFTGILTGIIEELGYRPHYYGPYSSEVEDAVGRLRGLGFVDQNVASVGAVDPSGFEVARYDFTLNEQGKQIAETKARDNPEIWGKIKAKVAILKKAGDADYMKLSIAAKTFFMLGEKKETMSYDELAKLAARFGWKVNAEQVKDAAKLLESVGLVNVVKKD